jgi:RimJ/RimL family protein N-acetyltransferase
MRLEPYTEADFELTEALDGDPEVMRDLGGAVPADRLPAVHRLRLNPPPGDRYFTAYPEGSDRSFGLVGLWHTEWEGGTVPEAGVLVRRRYLGTGLGVRALQALFALLVAEGMAEPVHAFIAVDNAASNTLARRMGFTLLGECDVSYEGRPLRSNHWTIRLGSSGS